jgi:hypothetical protein
MSNLVRRLRDPEFGTETSERNLMNQAADEIERLRAALKEIRDADLIEVKPRIKREVWVNVHRDGCLSAWRHKPEPNEFGPDDDRIACVKLTIDCEEGEGL